MYLPGTPLISGMTASTGHDWTRSYEPNRNLITAVTNAFNGNLISAFDYTNDEIGRRAARLDVLPNMNATTNAFGYNARSEVISANMGTNTYGYVFDPIGNRINATNNAEVTSYAANALNQYTTISNAIPVLPVHDVDGNMLTNGVWAYTWDGENRLIGVSSNDVLLVTYTYDHQFRRVGKGAGETTQSFLYDGWNLIQETSGTNSTHYVWGLDLSGSLQGAGGVGGLLAVFDCEKSYYPAFDANGNICEYSDAFGVIVALYEYSPFGEIVHQSNFMADAFTFRFSTKWFESESGLYYYGYRFYLSEMGRWLNRDPLMNEETSGLYSFVRNETMQRIDDLGAKSIGVSAFVSTKLFYQSYVDEIFLGWNPEDCICKYYNNYSLWEITEIWTTVVTWADDSYFTFLQEKFGDVVSVWASIVTLFTTAESAYEHFSPNVFTEMPNGAKEISKEIKLTSTTELQVQSDIMDFINSEPFIFEMSSESAEECKKGLRKKVPLGRRKPLVRE